MRATTQIVRCLAAAALAAAAAGCATLAGGGPDDDVGRGTGPANLHGKVVFDRKPIVGAEVALYAEDDATFRAAPLLIAGPTDDTGEFAVDVPAGRYYAVARKAADGGETRYYGYFGGNPVALRAGERFYMIFNTVDRAVAVDLSVADAARLPGSGVLGVVADAAGRPVAGAHVYAYLTTKKGFRDRPYEMSARTGPDGFFSIALPPGDYYLLARRRRAGGFAGPMRIGDLSGYLPDNPRRIEEGRYARVAIPIVEILDPARVARTAAMEASGGKAPDDPIDPTATFIGPRAMFRQSTGADARVRGVIRDAYGTPVRGFHATLYRNPDFLWQPDAISAETGPDGRYEVVAPAEGAYYVGARNYYGRQLELGDFYGFREEGPVDLRAGDVRDGVDIIVREYGFE